MTAAADRAFTERVLAERARVLAQPVVTEVAVPTIDLVQFSAGSERYAIAAPFVQRFERLGRITPLPGAARHFSGVINVHGALLALIDLRVLLGGAPCANAAFAIVIGRERAEFALVAETLLDMRAEPAEGLRNVLPDGTAVLDGNALIADPRLIAGEESTR
jgi:purine-binding chemotaxis protein CheW